MFIGTLPVVLLSALSCVLSLPSVQTFGPGGIQLLYQNDLNVNTAPLHQSVLLLPAQKVSKASSACSALSETLLPRNDSFFQTDLKKSLQYLTFTGRFPATQEFWIAPKVQTGCQTVNTAGQVFLSSCSRTLPVLCSQSAPFNIPPTTDGSAPWQVSVQSKELKVTGFRDQLSFRFLGIPFANPPERFTYSEAYTGNPNIDATAFKPPCIQTGATGASEDCLTLNVFTSFIPASPSSSPLKPVVFWIHGGAFTGGSNSDPTFDGGNMVSRGDVVYVNIQYRLSTLGFLALDDGKTNGNFGLADQIVALDWVREHIADFGGDPNHITIFGQSAGAASVRALMASPKAIGKFQAAVPMSNLAGANYATTYSKYFTIPDEVAQVANPILQLTGCNKAGVDPLACLRAVDANTLVNLPTVARFLVVDGTILTSDGLPLDGSGPIAKVHTMMGFMRDDGSAFIGFPTNSNLTQGLVGASLPPNVADHPELFPVPTGSDGTLDVFNITSLVTTDVEFRCLDQATAVSAINHDLLKSVWFYQFDRSYQTPGFSPNPPHCEAPIDATHPNGDPSKEYFKCHSGELFYTFGNLVLPFRDAIDLPFMQLITDTWTSFFRTFNPNPDQAYLSVRGYSNSLAAVRRDAPWVPVTRSNLDSTSATTGPLRLLNSPSSQSAFQQNAQCSFLQFPFTFFG